MPHHHPMSTQAIYFLGVFLFKIFLVIFLVCVNSSLILREWLIDFLFGHFFLFLSQPLCYRGDVIKKWQSFFPVIYWTNQRKADNSFFHGQSIHCCSAWHVLTHAHWLIQGLDFCVVHKFGILRLPVVFSCDKYDISDLRNIIWVRHIWEITKHFGQIGIL